MIQHRVLHELVFSARRMGNLQLAVRSVYTSLHLSGQFTPLSTCQVSLHLSSLHLSGQFTPLISPPVRSVYTSHLSTCQVSLHLSSLHLSGQFTPPISPLVRSVYTTHLSTCQVSLHQSSLPVRSICHCFLGGWEKQHWSGTHCRTSLGPQAFRRVWFISVFSGWVF